MFVGIEGLTPAFHDELVAPEAYFPDGARWLVVDSDACRRTIEDLWKDAEARFAERKVTKDLAHAAATATPSPRSRVFASPRRVELPTLEVTGDVAATKLRSRRRSRSRRCASSSSTRARSATPSTSARCSRR